MGSGQCSAEDARRKHALQIMNMPKRYSASARLLRVARICGKQVQRMSSYLGGRPSSGPTRYETAWDLMLPSDPEQEGSATEERLYGAGVAPSSPTRSRAAREHAHTPLHRWRRNQLPNQEPRCS